jgi:hypothetical protein
MIRTALAAALVSTLVLATPVATAAPASSPFAPLEGFIQNLEKGMNAVLKGTDAKKSFGALPAKERKRIDFGAATVSSLTLLAMEFELVLLSKKTPVYYLRTAVHGGKQGVGLLSFSGRPVEGGKLFVKALPMAAYRGPGAALGRAGVALGKVVAGTECAALRVATLAELPEMPAGKGLERARRDLERTRAGLAAECAKLKAVAHDAVELRVDDVIFSAADEKGKMIGMVKTSLEVTGGGLLFEYGKFRPVQ